VFDPSSRGKVLSKLTLRLRDNLVLTIK